MEIDKFVYEGVVVRPAYFTLIRHSMNKCEMGVC